MRKWVALALAAIATAGLAAAACGDESDESEVETGGGQTAVAGTSAVKIAMEGFSFRPETIAAKPGETVNVELSNQSSAAHTFTIADLGVDRVLQPGETANLSFTPERDATLGIVCRFHQGMRGTLTVGTGGPTASGAQASPSGSAGGLDSLY